MVKDRPEMDFDGVFDSIVEEQVTQEANELLDKQVERVRRWVVEHDESTDPATLNKLIKQVLAEKNKRTHVLVAFCAALWRLKDVPQ